MGGWSKSVRNRRDDALSRVDWRDFERLLADYYRRQGYRVEHCGTGANASRFDGGIDLKLFRDDAYLVVQCKHWNVRQVPHNAMHELAGIMLTERATGAILVTSGEFTTHARESAAKVGNMQLIDGDALRTMVGPVPEPPVQIAPPEDRAARILSAVGERVLHAAEERIRYGSRGRPSRIATAFVWLPLAKFVLLLLMAWAFFAFLSSVLSPESLLRGVPQPVTQAPAAVAPTVVAEPMPEPPSSAPTQPYAAAYVPPPRPPTDAERREQQRLADEAMRVLAPNTPEMDMGHPDDPRANRYKAPERPVEQSAGWGR